MALEPGDTGFPAADHGAESTVNRLYTALGKNREAIAVMLMGFFRLILY